MALTDTAIRKIKPTEKSFKITDSAGLYLLIKPNGSKLWYMKYRVDGKEKKLAFGPYPDVSLFKAHQLRDAARARVREGVDPAADKKIAQQKKKNGHTFRQIAMNWHADHRRWSEHYAMTIRRRLEMYVFPDIGDKFIDQIATEDLLVSIHKIKLKSRGNPFSRKMSFPFSRPLCSCNFSFAKSLSSTAPAPDLKAAPDMSVMVTKNLTAAAFENCRITVPSWLKSHFTCDCSSLRRNAAFFTG